MASVGDMCSLGTRFLECRLIFRGGVCRSVPRQRFRPRGGTVQEADRECSHTPARDSRHIASLRSPMAAWY